jgi:hypothetical protein
MLSPITVLSNNAIAARVWFLATLTLTTWLFAQPYLVIQAMKQKEKVVMVDGAGTIVYAPLLAFSEAVDLQAYHIRLACLAILQRNPQGSDFPELIDPLFIEPARTKAKKLLAATQQEFLNKQIHQKVEIGRIRVLETKTIDGIDAFLCEAAGQVIRAGRANDLPFVEPAPFVLRFLLVRNNNLTTNAKLPLVVHQFDFVQ